MKKLTLLVACSMLLQIALAGGLLTNYNQSAQYIRMLSRNAALEIDAVFYNPAGLAKMEDGWHFAFYSQTIFQTRDIDSQFPLLNSGHYEGEAVIPVYPDLYAVYKKDKWAFSLGIGPVAGGGTVTFDNGIPSLEIPFSKIPSALSGLTQIDPALDVTGYDLEMAFDVASTFWGIQLGASYAINDKFSAYGGIRLLPSTTKYEGAIRNIQLTVDGQNYSAATWLNGTADQLSGLAGQASSGGSQYAAAAATAGDLSVQIADAISAGLMNADDPLSDPQLIGALQQYGIDPTDITNGIAVQVFSQTASALGEEAQELVTKAAVLSGTSQTLAEKAKELEDKEVEVTQKGLGFTPIIGFNYSPNDDWNFAAKYEFKTKLTLENDTEIDQLGLFPDGAEVNHDVPAILALGVGYRGLDWLEAQLSYTIYFDKGVDYGDNIRYKVTDPDNPVHRAIDKNFYELSLGLQFNLSEEFAISVGGMRSKNGVTPQYQSDFSYSNSSKTLAGGIMWKITDKLILDAGVSNTFYEDDTVTFTDPDVGSYDETYGKTTLCVSAGISYSIF